MSETEPAPPSARTTVRRGAANARYDRETVHAILDAGLVAHVGVTTPDGPIVLPMAYGRSDTELYLHGAVGNAMLRAADGMDVCATVTVVDGLVIARAPFHNTMRYRSVVVRGRAELVEAERKGEVLKVITDHVVANWDTGRVPTESELRATAVLAVPLTECSAKVREGGPRDEAEDLDGPHWAGSLPIESRWAEPEPAHDLPDGLSPPPTVLEAAGQPLP